ncbi:hypothetical protein C3747_547g55c [Trypanosoma cruzi]|uniref:Mucin-associated surface protein (MASP) n=2 Tax=Trypanosoma cruzi TaxID=5693 RepID=Q4CYR2_TRYCC|nr:hypothetical protein, conserved [Trypanosoma cruzi]EAN85415.1 hypothetical protein, conserved [Trypanosoma cruzi]PWU86395.1 hypothetical protein C3747_547g55c [Trypanosoma cruzi]|eukprot:XP_807266.1 hypothetical protein [Trypanosoma cruzi strain CL Brener]
MASTYALIVSAFLAVANAVAAEDNQTSTKENKKEFPLVWVCLGVTIVGIGMALYIAYRRPDELHLPGSTVMVSTEMEEASGNNEPTMRTKLNDDLEKV